MGKKRGQGEGSVVPYGKRWRAFVTLPDGRPNRIFNTKKEANAWVREMTGQAERGLTVAGLNTRFEDFIIQWLESIKRTLKPNSYMNYSSAAHNHLIPIMGNMKLGTIKPAVIDLVYSRLVDKGASLVIVKQCHAVLSKSLGYAADSDIIPVNPMSKVKPPKVQQKEIEIMTEDEMSRYLVTASGHRLWAFFCLAVTTGMRKMELAGLTWDNIDWDERVVKVRQQLNYSGKTVSLKSRSSRRDIDITDRVIKILMEHEARQKEEMEIMGWKNERNLVFLSPIGIHLGPTTIRNVHLELLVSAGVPHRTFHSLRHYHITYLLMKDTPILSVCQRAGHSSPAITLNIYGHFIRSYQRQVANIAADIIPIEVDHI